ncbi:unnamed protein product [Calypogeia fissa]
MQGTRQIGLLFVAAAARRNTREEGERDERSKSSTHRGRATDGKSEEKCSSCTVVIGAVVSGQTGQSERGRSKWRGEPSRTQRTNDAKTTASRRTKDAYEGGGRGGGGDQRTEPERERGKGNGARQLPLVVYRGLAGQAGAGRKGGAAQCGAGRADRQKEQGTAGQVQAR